MAGKLSVNCRRPDSVLKSTFADTVGVSQHSAFLDCSKRVEQSPDIILIVFLGDHSDKQFALISVLSVGRFHLDRVVHLEA